MNEVWCPIVDLPGYLVSNLGRVKSKTRMVRTCGGGARLVKDRILAQYIGTHGYLSVTIRNRSYLVHRLVAEAHLPPAPGLEVNHKDGNKSNSHLSNLEWATRSENAAHAIRLGLMLGPPRMCGESNPNSKLTDAHRELVKLWGKQGGVKKKHIARCFNVSPGLVSQLSKQ